MYRGIKLNMFNKHTKAVEVMSKTVFFDASLTFVNSAINISILWPIAERKKVSKRSTTMQFTIK